MSDAVLIALITNATTIAVVILSRWFSHREHKKTEAKVNSLLNGGVAECD